VSPSSASGQKNGYELLVETGEIQSCLSVSLKEGFDNTPAYVAEDAFAKVEILEKYYEHFKVQLGSGDDFEKYCAIEVLRALAENPRTPEHIINDLAQIHENSLRHETRSVNGGDDP
jgi:hypothetical protein